MAIPIIGGGGASSATGPTLLTLRTRLAEEFMFHLTTSVSATATLGDVKRMILADELRDDENSYDMTGLMWLYLRATSTQRRIVASPVADLQPMGGIALSRPLSSAAASASVIDVTGPLPMRQAGMVKGLQESLFEGLRRIWTRARLPLTGTGTRSASLAAYPWLTRYEQILGIYDTVWDDDPVTGERAPYAHRLVINNVARTLITEQTYATSETLYLDVLVRASQLVYDGASWSYVTSLAAAADTWQFACPEEWAVQFGLWRASRYARLWLKTVRMDADRKAAMLDEVEQRFRSAVGACNRIKSGEMPKPPAERPEPITSPPRDLDYVV